MNLNPRKIPVFVFPTSLKFYLSSRSTHKQILTLYNPYEFAVKFKVLCTAPNKYSVIDPDGSIGPQSCVDIVIRHNAPNISNCNVTDKFRISMEDQDTRQMGKRDIEAVMYESEREIGNDGDFYNVPFSDRSRGGTPNLQPPEFNRRPPFVGPQAYHFVLVVAATCVLILFIPSYQDVVDEKYSFIPKHLHLNVQIKYIAAYVLGMITSSLLKMFA